MMFNSKFVVCIKVNGKILREFKDIVKLPFGTEFSILLKNLNTVRAQVSVSIDGTDATENVFLVIDPNSELELTRFIKNGNLTQGNCFKFIERTEGIEQYRGVKADDGVVRVEFQFEKALPYGQFIQTVITTNTPRLPWLPSQFPNMVGSTQSYPANSSAGGLGSTALYSATLSAASTTYTTSACSGNVTNTLRSVNSVAKSVSDAGITVPGSESSQKFSTTSWFQTEPEKHVIVLKLVGDTDTGVQYVAPVTVRAKPKCQTCGRVNKATNKFCSECGTALMVL